MRIDQKNNIFEHGSTWLRADFHLHTKADKEFCYTGEDDCFVSDYVTALKIANIQVGVITNHNKFNVDEFKAVRKKAWKEDIFLLPGVELSVNDGSNGIHTLIVFSDQWWEKGNDYISPLITSMFPGKADSEYQQENGRSDKNILQVVEELEKTGRDYFLVFAHVEQKSGLWSEMGGGKLGDFVESRYDAVRKKTLGFQKVRTHDVPDKPCRLKVKGWLKDWYPAEVEGSDCKNIAEIGKGEKGFIKLGAFSFDAVKFALMDKESRVNKEAVHYQHSHIRCMRFTGGTLGGQEIHFSPELNTMIGIRGSGKSSVLEVLRYALDIPFGIKAGDIRYKNELVAFTLGNGGKVEIDAVNRHGQVYTIRRSNVKDSYSEVMIEGKLQPGVSIQETVVHKPLYFGQKDLSSTGEGFETDLVDKLLGSQLDDVRRRIAAQKERVIEAVDRLLKVTSDQGEMEEQRRIKQDTEHKLQFYRNYGIEEKLQKQLDFDHDARVMNKGVQLGNDFLSAFEDVLAQYEDEIRNVKGYQSQHNAPLFSRFYQHYETYITLIDHVKNWLGKQKEASASLSNCQSELTETRKSMVEEFAEIERRLAAELKNSGSQHISSEEFLALKTKLEGATQFIVALQKQGDQKKVRQDALFDALVGLNKLWQEEFNQIKSELDKVGAGSASILITSGYKGDKEAFFSFMKELFKGNRFRETTYQGIVNTYDDFIAIYQDFEQAKTLFGNNPQIFIDLFMKHLKTLLTYQTPHKFTIRYRGKALQHHSLGQRASALILFILSQKENDVVIIDQPEDDLDNQTIYEDVIKLIREIKPQVQFIFATHNPNIPVLGDAEQVHACAFVEDKITVCSGSVDAHDTQTAIVNVMEGGREAFNRRKEIYQIWKS